MKTFEKLLTEGKTLLLKTSYSWSGWCCNRLAACSAPPRVFLILISLPQGHSSNLWFLDELWDPDPLPGVVYGLIRDSPVHLGKSKWAVLFDWHHNSVLIVKESLVFSHVAGEKGTFFFFSDWLHGVAVEMLNMLYNFRWKLINVNRQGTPWCHCLVSFL